MENYIYFKITSGGESKIEEQDVRINHFHVLKMYQNRKGFINLLDPEFNDLMSLKHFINHKKNKPVISS